MNATDPLPPMPAKVAVIVPAYGVAHLVGEALSSLQAQTLKDWECLVIDDGAPDDVACAVAPYLADQRITFLHTENQGVSAARNRAISATHAPLISLLDGDDLLRPTYLETMVAVLEGDPTIRLATCNARLFGAVLREQLCVERPQGQPHATLGTLSDVLDRSFNVYIGTTFRRSDFDAIGGFDVTMAQSEDFDLWVRLMMLGGHAHYVDAILGDYRVRPGSASANSGRMLVGNIKVYEKAATALPANAAEQALLKDLIASSRRALNFEHAIDRIIDGDTRRGVDALCSANGPMRGVKWQLLLALWSLVPALARPMLQWRRRAHRRGAMGFSLFHRQRQRAS